MSPQELQVQQKREVEKKQESTVPARAYLPMTDIFETEEVRVENEVLTIEGRLDFSNYDGLQPVYTEYNIGNYARSFEVPSKIDSDRITADLKDGVMTLVLPKAEKAKPRRIAVN